MEKLLTQILQFKRAIARLEEALGQEKNDFLRDASIQRFEFSLDLCWKTVKTFLEERKGIICTAPKDCFRAAYQHGLIEYDDQWIKLVEMRNETVHTYNENVAEKIYAQLPAAAQAFQKLLATLETQ